MLTLLGCYFDSFFAESFIVLKVIFDSRYHRVLCVFALSDDILPVSSAIAG